MGPAKDTERAVRLRDNKRRHRLRKKEYVEDLERRLAEARADGVQATKEVQVAAPRVVWENSRLRQILREEGLSSDAIESLIYRDGPYESDAPPSRSVDIGAPSHRPRDDKSIRLSEKEAPGQPHVDSDSSACDRTPPVAKDLPSGSACSSESAYSERTAARSSPPPCKLLTILAGNPNVDVTQPLPVTNDGSEDKETDSVDCLRAREMLMRYATSEQKLNEVCRSLEQGCVKNKSGGGCHVKNDVILEALDRLCE